MKEFEMESFDEIDKAVGLPDAQPLTEVDDDDEDCDGGCYERKPETWEPFPLDVLPPVTREFVTERARQAGQNPAAFALFVVAFAGQLVGQTMTAIPQDGWRICPTFWLGYVARSGVGKSIVTNLLTSLVQSRQRRYDFEHSWLLRKYAKAQKPKRRKSKNQDDSNDSEGEGGWAAYFAECGQPICRCLFVTDATLEALQLAQKRSPWGVSIVKDELATLFANMRRTKDAGAASDWYAGWDGGSVRVVRLGRETVAIDRAFWSILGGGTPSRLAELFSADGFESDGLLSRFLLICPPTPTPERLQLRKGEASDKMREVFEILADVNELPNGYPEECPHSEPVKPPFELTRFDDGKPKCFYLSGEAWKEFQSWDFSCRQKAYNASSEIEAAFWSKARGYSLRFALTLLALYAAEDVTTRREGGDCSPIRIEHEIPLKVYRDGERLAQWAVRETLETCKLLGFIKPNDADDVLAAIATEGKPVGFDEITRLKGLRRFREGKARKKLEKILKQLVKRGKLQRVSGQRGSVKYFVLH